MSRAYQYPYPLPKHTDEPKKEINDDRQISKRGNAPLGVRSAGISRRGNGSRGAARPRIDQLHLQTRLAGRPSPARPADREGRLKACVLYRADAP